MMNQRLHMSNTHRINIACAAMDDRRG